MECVREPIEFTIAGYQPSCVSLSFLTFFTCCLLTLLAKQATVLLNANVGFLAIQSVDDGGGNSLRQIASYMSLMASFASIMLGLVFVGHNRTESRNSVFAAVGLPVQM